MKKLLGIFGVLIGLMTFVKVQTGIGTMTPVNKFQEEVSTTDQLNSGSTANGKIIPPNVDYSKLTPSYSRPFKNAC